MPLITPSEEAGGSAVPDHVPEIPHLDKSVEPSAATDSAMSDGKCTPSATAILLCGVRDSQNGFGPLKSNGPGQGDDAGLEECSRETNGV